MARRASIDEGRMTVQNSRMQCSGCFQLLILLLLLPTALSAQTNIVPASGISNHYLIIVETSRAMQNRGRGIFDSMTNLLGSAIQGQLRQGDALELWSFNENLYAS